MCIERGKNMVKGISAVDSLYNSTKNVVTNNKKTIAVTAVGGAGVYAAHSFFKQLANDEISIGHTRIAYETDKNGIPLDGPLGYVPRTEYTDAPTLWEKVSNKVLEKFNIDMNKVPDWVDPSNRYLTDSTGKNLISNITNQPYINPWYNPELADAPISAVSSLQMPRPTMADFLEKAGFDNSDKVVDAAVLGTDIDVDADDNLIERIANGVKKIFETVIDNI